MPLHRSLLALTVFAVSNTFAAEHNEAWIERQIERIKASENNAWRKIPWTSSLLDARRASEKEKKPIFLFTHDGNIETGRC